MRTLIRVVLGSFLAGFALFTWGFVAHMLTPLGTMGMKAMPHETELSAEMKDKIKESGLYLFPAPNLEHGMSSEEMNIHMEKAMKGPTGMLIIQPAGSRFTMQQQLGFELASNIAASFVAAVLLACTRLPFVGRVLFVTTLGLSAWLSVCASYWTWYAFPNDFTIAALIDETGAFLVVGIVLAMIFRPVTVKIVE